MSFRILMPVAGIASHRALACFQAFLLITEVVQAVPNYAMALTLKMKVHPWRSPTHAFYRWKTEGKGGEEPIKVMQWISDFVGTERKGPEFLEMSSKK